MRPSASVWTSVPSGPTTTAVSATCTARGGGRGGREALAARAAVTRGRADVVQRRPRQGGCSSGDRAGTERARDAGRIEEGTLVGVLAERDRVGAERALEVQPADRALAVDDEP